MLSSRWMLVPTALLAMSIDGPGRAAPQLTREPVAPAPVTPEPVTPEPMRPRVADPSTGRTFDLPAVHELRDVRVEPEVRELVSALADASYEKREAAMASLADGEIPIEQLCAALQQPRLSPEQEYRLLMIVRQALLTAPRGAVGIKVDERWLPTHIIIQDLIRGLPAAEVLKVGDRITHLQGQELKNWDDFRRAVQSKTPGDLVAMTVQRPLNGGALIGDAADETKYETKELELRLGSADLLVDNATGLPQRNGPLERQRQTAANEATRRYAPRAMTVKLDGTDDVVVKHPFDFEIESNAHIRAALREQELIRRGELVLTPQLQAERMRQLELFKLLASDPTLSDQLRDMHRRLAERYAELIRR